MLEKTIEKLEKEMMDLDYQLKKVIPKEILKARELGDLSENAEYHAAKERQRMTETRISHIQGRIRDLNNIDLSKISENGVGLGSIVVLEDLNTGNEITYELVMADMVDVDAGKISLKAPVGRALMGKAEDDEAVVDLPGGKKEYLIKKVTTIHQRKL